MIRLALFIVLIGGASFANPIKKSIYEWYSVQENMRLEKYSYCLLNVASSSDNEEGLEKEKQRCETLNELKAASLKQELDQKLAEVKPLKEGDDGAVKGIADQHRKRFYFKECIKFSQTEEDMQKCYEEYQG